MRVPAPSPLLRAILACVCLLGLALSGCGSGAEAPNGRIVNVTERDFAISAPAHLAAGRVDLQVHNAGPDRHELILVRTKEDELPYRTDGITANEEHPGGRELGAL